MSWLYLLVGLVVAQRLAELILAGINTRRLNRLGAIEIGAGHYPLFILLHSSWLAAVLFTSDPFAQPIWPLVWAFLVIEAGRIWVLASLGRFFTTRIITLPGAPLVRRGPYRFIDHPNYLVVVGEIAVLPLIFGNWHVALIWSALNAALLVHRIRVENAALADRRGAPPVYSTGV